MALLNYTGINQGLMGVGFQYNQASLDVDQPSSFPPILEQLKAKGLIDRAAYSLFLDDYDGNTGSILFGGIDSSRMSGELLSLPLSTDDYGHYHGFRVALTQISYHDEDSTQALTKAPFIVAALLDFGATMTYLPRAIFEELMRGLGATAGADGYYYVPCAYRTSNTNLVYSFGGAQGVNVSVPLSELIGEELGPFDGYNSDTPACSLNVARGYDDVILGDSFLRSAYAVYDLENYVVALGQSNVFKKAVDPAAITSIPTGMALPGVSKTARVTASVTAFGRLDLGGVVSPTFDLGMTVTATPTSTSGLIWDKNGAGEFKVPKLLGCSVAAIVAYFYV